MITVPKSVAGAPTGIIGQAIDTAKQAFKTAAALVTPQKQIVDVRNTNNYGVVGFPIKALQEIYKKSGKFADEAEFQVDYWALNFRATMPDGSHLDIAVPLIFFNYKQEVSGARIDFEMADVKAISDKLTPVAQKFANDVLATQFKAHIEKLFNIKFEPMLVPLNTIHKHPGSSTSQSFSGTDLTKNPSEHGVVYPWEKIDEPDIPNFASIMAIDSKINNLAHSEYRIVNGTLGTDITYQQGRCLSFTVGITPLSSVESLMNPGVTQELNVRYKESLPAIAQTVKEQLVRIYSALYEQFVPFTDTVDEANITKKATTYYSYSGGTYHYGGYKNPYEKQSKRKKKKPKPDIDRYLTMKITDYQSYHVTYLRSILEALAAFVDEPFTQVELDAMEKETVIDNIVMYSDLANYEKQKPKTSATEDLVIYTREELDTFTRMDLLDEIEELTKLTNTPHVLNTRFGKTDAELITMIITQYKLLGVSTPVQNVFKTRVDLNRLTISELNQEAERVFTELGRPNDVPRGLTFFLLVDEILRAYEDIKLQRLSAKVATPATTPTAPVTTSVPVNTAPTSKEEVIVKLLELTDAKRFALEQLEFGVLLEWYNRIAKKDTVEVTNLDTQLTEQALSALPHEVLQKILRHWSQKNYINYVESTYGNPPASLVSIIQQNYKIFNDKNKTY